MKYILFLGVFAFTFLPLHAYKAGTANRTNFASGQQQPQAQNNYRAFSNYNNRNWSKGVQTQPVKTEVAGTSAVDFDEKTPQKLVAKTQAAATAKPVTATPQKPTANAPTTGAPVSTVPANADPAVMMQQVQGLMQAVGSMSGANVQPGQAAAVPDISALMGAGSSTPAAAPAKK